MINGLGNIGNKFNADGSIRFFPGNTILSFINHDSIAWKGFQVIRNMLLSCEASRCMTMLPDSSIHMTVIEGVCHDWRFPESWTKYLPIDCRLEETDLLFEKAFKTVKPLGNVNMRMDHVDLDYGSSIRLAPATEADVQELKRFRDDCSAALGVRLPNHDWYEFHVSICYFTKQPTLAEEEELLAYVEHANEYLSSKQIIFPLEPAQLTYFNDMGEFKPERFDRNGL